MLTNTPWGQKDFGAKLNETDLTLKYKSFVKLWSLPDTAHCEPGDYNGTIIFEIDLMKKSSPINLNLCQT
jgi:hypothetical protein